MLECQRIRQFRFFLCNRHRPWPAVLQQFSVFNVRMTDRPVCEKSSLFIHSRSFCQKCGHCSVNIGFTDYRNALFIENRICCTWHNSDFCLKRIPTLDRSCLTSIFLYQTLHCQSQSCYHFYFLFFDLDNHGILDVSDHLLHFFFVFTNCFYFFCQLCHRNRRQLNIKFFEQFSFIAHCRPEVKRTC